MEIKIGTRSSPLALWQAELIGKHLKTNGLECKIIPIETKGDKILDKTLSKIGSKGVFTEELEQMLIEDKIDIAVHSAKDLPSTLHEELDIIAFTEREKHHDVVVSYDPNFKLPSTKRIGTSSTRRIALLKKMYPEIKIVDARGNLHTRFKKMENGEYDAMLLAYAGVYRMGFDKYIVQNLSINEFVPPAGQGSIAVEAHIELAVEKRESIRDAINNLSTETVISAERAFLHRFKGGCSIPVFVTGELKDDELYLTGGIISLDGKEEIKETISGKSYQFEELGTELAQKVLRLGGDKILEKIKNQLL